MNKTEFMKKLAGLLKVLQEDEIRDILSEYEQHIDMKMESGLSEKEAIEDFGSVEELAADILSAYHVRVDSKKEAGKGFEVIGKVTNGSKKACSNAGSMLKKMGNSAGSFCKRAWDKLKYWCKKPFVFMDDFLNRKGKNNMDEKASGESKRGIIGQFFHICMKCIFAMLFALTGFTGIFAVLGVGFLAVMIVLGYPVLGIFLGMLGMTMALAAFLFFSGIMMRRK